MTFVLYVFLGAANLFFCIEKKKSISIQAITLLFVCLIFVGSRNTLDLDNYIEMYETDLESIRGLQFYYWGLMNVCIDLGLSFYQFRFVLSAIALTLLFIFIRKASYNPHLVLLIYLLYPIFMDDIQIRNFVATSFLYIGIYYALEEKRNWKIYLSISILLATFNHVLFLVYFVFLLSINNKRKLYYYIAFFFLLTIFLVLNKDRLGLLYTIMTFVDSGRADTYAEASTRYGALLFVIYQAITLALYRKLISLFRYQSFPDKIIRTANILFRLNVLISVCLPLIVIDFNFYRLMRSMFIVNVICFSNTLFFANKRRNILLYIALYFYLWVNVDLFAANNFEERVIPIFQYNTLSW